MSRLFYFSSVGITAPALAFAHGTLPYSVRTKPYSGVSTTTHGDIRTVGMAGATAGLADTFIAAINNPAGLGMTLDNADSHYTENFIRDERVQDYRSTTATTSLGAAMAVYPWAFAIGYLSPYRENDVYAIPSASNREASLDVITRELHFSVARVFWDNRISLGASLAPCQSRISSEFYDEKSPTWRRYDYSLGLTLGLSAKLPKQFIFGFSYRMPMRYNFNPATDSPPDVPGLAQPVLVPRRYELALAWIPNRYIRGDFTLEFIGKTPGAALLRDETVEVGNRMVTQPHLGIAYIFADYKDFKGTLFAGTYLEHSRIDEYGSRFHKTAGVEMKPWVITVGWGIDTANGYKNYLVSLGIDLFKVMEKGDLIPQPWSPGHNGFLPNPAYVSDVGLARPLQENWKPQGPDLNPITVGLDIPRKFEQKVRETSEKVMQELRPYRPFKHSPRINAEDEDM